VTADSEAHIVFPAIARTAWLRDTAQIDSTRAPQSVWSLYLYDNLPAGLHVEVGRGTQRASGDGTLSGYLADARVMITWPSGGRASEFDDLEYVPNLQPVAVGNRVALEVRGAAFAKLFSVHRDTARCDYGSRGVQPVEEYVAVQYVK
jgi:hypothetical protein